MIDIVKMKRVATKRQLELAGVAREVQQAQCTDLPTDCQNVVLTHVLDGGRSIDRAMHEKGRANKTEAYRGAYVSECELLQARLLRSVCRSWRRMTDKLHPLTFRVSATDLVMSALLLSPDPERIVGDVKSHHWNDTLHFATETATLAPQSGWPFMRACALGRLAWLRRFGPKEPSLGLLHTAVECRQWPVFAHLWSQVKHRSDALAWLVTVWQNCRSPDTDSMARTVLMDWRPCVDENREDDSLTDSESSGDSFEPCECEHSEYIALRGDWTVTEQTGYHPLGHNASQLSLTCQDVVAWIQDICHLRGRA